MADSSGWKKLEKINSTSAVVKNPKSKKKETAAKSKSKSKSNSKSNKSKSSASAKRKKAPTPQQLTFYGQLAKQAKQRSGPPFGPSPAHSLQQAMGTMSVLKELQEGIPITKISHSGDMHRRVLALSPDKCTIFITHRKIANKNSNSNSNKGEDHQQHVSKLPKPLYTPSKGWNAEYQRYIDVADISEIQAGVIHTQVLEKTLGKQKDSKKKDDLLKNLITIHHQEYLGRRSLNILVDNPSHRMALFGALATIRQTYDDESQWIGREILLLRYIWYDVDSDRNSMISEKEFIKICERINFYVPDAGKQFREYLKTNEIKNDNKKKEVTYAQCTNLLHSLKEDNVVDEVWKRVFGNVNVVTAKIFHETFLKKVQGEKQTTLQDAKDLIASINTVEMDEGSQPSSNQRNKLNKIRFAEYLRSEWNDAYDPEMQQVPKRRTSTPPLNKPLCQYWINTSHNTYLLGDQLKSKSSVEAYTNALQRGCKCLELDCWNGPAPKKNGDLVTVVYHGHTLTSKIPLRDILLVVKNYLLANPNTYPIILSLENHCTQPFQVAMAKMIQKIFGARLFLPTSAQRTMKMPSPEELKGKVLIKGKRPAEPDDGDEAEESGNGDSNNNDNSNSNNKADDPYANLFETFDLDVKPPQSSRVSTFIPKSLYVGASSADQYEATSKKGGKNKKKNKNNQTEEGDENDGTYARELLELTYFHGTKFKCFEDSIAFMPSHMHSIGETKIVKIATQYDNHPDLWREFNAGHMTRTYPAGKRVDSSNYNPLLAWAMGCQLVALNFQTHDINLIINDGRFRQGGNCGYVEKPETVMSKDALPMAKKMKIRIMAASCLPKPKAQKVGEYIDPLVKIELHDVQITKRGKEQYYTEEHVTKCVDNNGYAPVWNDKGKEFTVKNPDVAMLVFRVLDADFGIDDQIACAAVPVSCLRKGFRSIQLYDQYNARLGPFHYATLLVNIQAAS